MIPLEQLEEMFAGMRAQTRWDVDGPMLWGYFFTDGNEEKLKLLAERLSADGYRYVGIHTAEDDGEYVLHVERVETHSPETLHSRNAKLAGLADELGVATYDGMDVGPVAS